MKGPKNKATERAAWTEYNRLLGKGTAGEATVQEVINAYGASVEKAVERGELAASTIARQKRELVPFGVRYGHLLATDLRPIHIETWLNEERPKVNSTTRHTIIAIIKRAFSWPRR